MKIFLRMLIILTLPVMSWGEGKVAILRSSRFSLYDQLAEGFSSCTSAGLVADTVFSEDEQKNTDLLRSVQDRKPDVLVTLGTGSSRFVREKVKNIPSIFGGVVDPSSTGIAPPGIPLDLDPSVQLQFLKTHFPSFKRIGVLYSPGRNMEVLSVLRKYSSTKISLVLVKVPSIDKLEEAVQSLSGQVDCLLMIPDPIVYSNKTSSQLILQTIQMGIPLVAISLPFVKAGAMVGIYPDLKKSGCELARLTDSIIKGNPASSFVWPKEYAISVNLVVAGRLKVVIPNAVLKNAEKVIQ